MMLTTPVSCLEMGHAVSHSPDKGIGGISGRVYVSLSFNTVSTTSVCSSDKGMASVTGSSGSCLYFLVPKPKLCLIDAPLLASEPVISTAESKNNTNNYWRQFVSFCITFNRANVNKNQHDHVI